MPYEQSRRYANRVDMIVCSGGDGTLDEVVTGISEVNARLPLGYIPAGSTNDFANSLFIPGYGEGGGGHYGRTSVRCDIGSSTIPSLRTVAAFGLFTDVSYRTDKDLKNVLAMWPMCWKA